MHEGFNRIFWGMCFVTFHITIFGFEGLPLPAFAAYLMVWSGIKHLINESPQQLQEPSPDQYLERQPESGHHYFKRAAAAALISALIAVPRVVPAYFNQLLSQSPMAALLNLGLITLLDLVLAYYLLSGAVCLLENQSNPIRSAFYLKRLRVYLVLLSSLSIIGIAAMALGALTSGGVFSIAMLILRIWFLAMIYGLKAASIGQPSTKPSVLE